MCICVRVSFFADYNVKCTRVHIFPPSRSKCRRCNRWGALSVKSMRTMWNLGHKHWDQFFLRVPTSPSSSIGRLHVTQAAMICYSLYMRSARDFAFFFRGSRLRSRRGRSANFLSDAGPNCEFYIIEKCKVDRSFLFLLAFPSLVQNLFDFGKSVWREMTDWHGTRHWSPLADIG